MTDETELQNQLDYTALRLAVALESLRLSEQWVQRLQLECAAHTVSAFSDACDGVGALPVMPRTALRSIASGSGRGPWSRP